VSGNHGFGVQKFMNISGVTTTPGSGTHVFANSCTGCKFGINLWSLPYAANTGPVGLANVHIHDNTLRVNGPAWKEVCGNGLANGILLNAQSSLRVENLAVHHNHIVFATPEETGYKGEAGDALASGIEYRRASLDPAVVDQNVSFCDNTITNPTANGIRVVVLGNAFDISRNTIVNPGAGCVAAGGQVPNTSANGITILGALTDSRVNDNRVLDTRSSPAVNSGIVVLPTAPGSAGNEAIGNVVPVTKGRSVEVASGWFLRMDQPVVSLPCGPARVGSQLVDRSTGLVYRQGAAPEGTSWTAHVPGRVGVSGLDFAVPGVLRLPGLANNFVMTPAVAAMDMKGAFRLRVELALDDWEATTYVLTRWSGGVDPVEPLRQRQPRPSGGAHRLEVRQVWSAAGHPGAAARARGDRRSDDRVGRVQQVGRRRRPVEPARHLLEHDRRTLRAARGHRPAAVPRRLSGRLGELAQGQGPRGRRVRPGARRHGRPPRPVDARGRDDRRAGPRVDRAGVRLDGHADSGRQRQRTDRVGVACERRAGGDAGPAQPRRRPAAGGAGR
jgi:hypothetical protein